MEDQEKEDRGTLECDNCGGPCFTVVRDRVGNVFCSQSCKDGYGREKGCN